MSSIVLCSGGGGSSVYSEELTATKDMVRIYKIYKGKDTGDDQGMGNMPDNLNLDILLACGESYIIPLGYHDGNGKVSIQTLAAQTPATATASLIVRNRVAWVNGNRIVGTIGKG